MNYTSIEQSKKLLELGLNPHSADMYWSTEDTYGRTYAAHIGEHIAIRENLFSFRHGLVFPCWSVGVLLELMPTIIEKDGKVLRLRMDKGNNDYAIWYEELSTGLCDEKLDVTKNTFMDAAFEMVCWLKENKYI